MAREVEIVIIMLLILAVAISFLSLSIVKTRLGLPPNYETHSYTKAICNSTNYCQDYIVSCNGKQVLGLSPITGAVVQFSDSWEDPRTDIEINSFC
jgi:hypothetical protein